MHYFIDGYNLLFRIVDPSEDLQSHRDTLVRNLTEKIEALNLDVTIVFDATYAPGELSRKRPRQVEVVFTAEGETADKFIVTELEAIRKLTHETVVTSDKHLAWLARRLGAHTVDIEPFIIWLHSRYRNAKHKAYKAKDDILNRLPKIAVRVPPTKKEELPTVTKTPDECFDYYYEVFSKKAAEEPVNPKREAAPTPEKSPPKKPKKKKEPEEYFASDEERWLKLFTKQLDDSDEL
ncbi:MAG: NYN domain-containing protein [Chlamydiales bacterium]|nr:NYN domain-containing protein [Chlamydiales bacterium]